MTVLQRIQREPAALLGLVTAAVGFAVLLGLDPVVGGGITALVGAAVVCLRYFVTPASEVVVQATGDGPPVAGAALATIVTGHPVTIDVEPLPIDLPEPKRQRRDETGAVSLRALVAVLALLLIGTSVAALLFELG